VVGEGQGFVVSNTQTVIPGGVLNGNSAPRTVQRAIDLQLLSATGWLSFIAISLCYNLRLGLLFTALRTPGWAVSNHNEKGKKHGYNQ